MGRCLLPPDGGWPNGESGFIPHSGGETWKAVEMALFQGLRGLPGGLTLARLRSQSEPLLGSDRGGNKKPLRYGLEGV
jgi:hypothetical protein